MVAQPGPQNKVAFQTAQAINVRFSEGSGGNWCCEPGVSSAWWERSQES